MMRVPAAMGAFIVGLLPATALPEPISVRATQDPTVLQIASCQLKRSFHETFDDGFAITPYEVMGRSWIAHTPWNGDFGDAAFANPSPGFPFKTGNGVLTIEAHKVDDRWFSGLIASSDSAARGFAKQYGYFEIRAKLPPGKGLWPAIWLASAKPVDLHVPSVEIDLIEHYGQFPDKFNSVVHSWAAKNGEHVRPVSAHVQDVAKGSLYDHFRSYGIDVEPDWITFYFERQEFWRVKTPPEHKFPLMVLIDLALGSGWPIDEAPSPSFMMIQYVDVYERLKPC